MQTLHLLLFKQTVLGSCYVLTIHSLYLLILMKNKLKR